VATEHGPRPIETIREGDLVWSWDEATGTRMLNPVERTLTRVAPAAVEISVAGSTLVTTEEHPFWVQGEAWKPAGDLRAGDRVFGLDGSVHAVDGAAVRAGALQVYNLQVRRARNYYAGDVGALVHNVNDKCEEAPRTNLRLTGQALSNLANPNYHQGTQQPRAFTLVIRDSNGDIEAGVLAPRNLHGPNEREVGLRFRITNGAEAEALVHRQGRRGTFRYNTIDGPQVVDLTERTSHAQLAAMMGFVEGTHGDGLFGIAGATVTVVDPNAKIVSFRWVSGTLNHQFYTTAQLNAGGVAVTLLPTAWQYAVELAFRNAGYRVQ